MWLWWLLAVALPIAYLAAGIWFCNRTAPLDAKNARSAWSSEEYVRSSFRARQAVSAALWPFKLLAWSISGIGDERWLRYDPLAIERRERRIAELERELLGRRAS